MGLFEDLGLVDKCPCKIAQETEWSNEENYREHTRKLLEEARAFRDKHKEIIEQRLNKPIIEVDFMDLIRLGFDSRHITKKFLDDPMRI